MKKIPTIFPKDENDLSRVVNSDIMPDINHFKIKVDGTACMIKDGRPYCRFDAKLFKRKKGKVIHYTIDEVKAKLPEGAIACQDPDSKSGHYPHWIPVKSDDPSQKYILEGFNNIPDDMKIDGTYECVGPKLQGNPHGEDKHIWIPHFSEKLIVNIEGLDKYDKFSYLSDFLKDFPFEGLVAYNSDNIPIGKIRRSDFGHPKIKYNNISSIVY
jgi:hypothetical protein